MHNTGTLKNLECGQHLILIIHITSLNNDGSKRPTRQEISREVDDEISLEWGENLRSHKRRRTNVFSQIQPKATLINNIDLLLKVNPFYYAGL